MLSKTKVKFRAQKKTNPSLKETIRLALKYEKWKRVAEVLSGPTRNYASVNLGDIDKLAKTGDTIVVLGKVLSSGNLTKKVRLCALGFSVQAKSKLKQTKSEVDSIYNEILSNPKAQGVTILPWQK